MTRLRVASRRKQSSSSAPPEITSAIAARGRTGNDARRSGQLQVPRLTGLAADPRNAIPDTTLADVSPGNRYSLRTCIKHVLPQVAISLNNSPKCSVESLNVMG